MPLCCGHSYWKKLVSKTVWCLSEGWNKKYNELKLTSYPLATIQPSPFWCSISKEVLFSVCGTSSCNDEGSLDSMYLLLNSGIILYKSLSFFVFSGSLLFWNNKKRKILNSWNTGLWNWPTGAPRGHYLITKPPSHHFFSQTFFICLQRHPPDPRRPKGSQSGREKRREEIFPVNFNRAFSPDPSDCPLGSDRLVHNGHLFLFLVRWFCVRLLARFRHFVVMFDNYCIAASVGGRG